MDTNLMQQLHNQNDPPASPSPEMFSFPGTPTEPENDSDFEFGSCINPDSPTQADLTRTSSTSPADQFFLNGRLLPHDFPTTTTRNSFSATTTTTIAATLSRGTSIGSSASNSSCMTSSNKGSLTSSRSNSTNSSRTVGNVSTCSSARTSSSDVSERKAFRIPKRRNVSSGFGSAGGTTSSSSSQRWQFIAQAPVLGPSRSLRARKDAGVGPTVSPRNRKRVSNDNGNGNGILQRMLRSFIATCKACHAMEAKDNEFDLDNGSVLGN